MDTEERLVRYRHQPGVLAGSERLLELLVEGCDALTRVRALRRVRGVLLDVVSHATEPLRVAVTGDVSAGKSSLVNGLTGQLVARVAREEATAAVTWFRAPGAAVAPPLGPAHRSHTIESALTQVVTLVDTPGVNTVSGGEQVTDAMLTASQAAGAISVLIYLVDGTLTSSGRDRIRTFSALVRGPLDWGGAVVLGGAKADMYQAGRTPAGKNARGGPESIAVMVADLQAKARGLSEHAVPLMPALAAASCRGVLQGKLLDDIRAIARVAYLREGIAHGWDALKGRVAEQVGYAVDVDAISNRLCGPLGLQRACELLNHAPLSDPARAIRDLWLDMSGVRELHAVLKHLAGDGAALTASAVLGRLERMADGLDAQRALPLRRFLAALHREPAMVGYHRHLAALVLEGASIDYVPAEERQAAADVLRGRSSAVPRGELAMWQRRITDGGRPARDRRIARIVVEAAGSSARHHVEGL